MTAEQTKEQPFGKKQLFTSAEAHPLALNLCMLKEFGPEYLGWEPETCWDEIRLTWGISIADTCKQKIQAVRTIYVADDVLDEWQVFEAVTTGLVGGAPRADIIQRASPGRAHVALDVIKHIREPSTIDKEVYQYCAACLMDFGMIYGPGSLDPANQYIKNTSPEQETVRNLVRADTVPSAINGNTLVLVQTMKALAVKDFARSVEQLLVQQVRQLAL